MSSLFLTQKTPLIGLLLLTALVLISCTPAVKTPSASQLSYESFDFPDDVLVLGVSKTMTLNEIINGCDAGFMVKIPPLYDELLGLGYKEETIQDGSIALVLNSMYWNNASAPKRADYGMRWAIVPNDLILQLSTERHSVVEVQLKDGIGKIARIRHANFNDSDCRFKKDKRPLGIMILSSLTYFGVGPPGSSSLYCDGLEEGWEREEYGWNDEFIWVKYPDGYVPPEK